MIKTKGKSLVGLDIGSKYIKAIELTPTNNSYAILGYAYREITPGDDLKETLKELFQTTGFSTKKVVTAVSGRPVIVRYINMPEMSDEELQNAIKYEASKYIPFEADEVVLDCQRMDYETKASESEPSPTSKEMRVILVAAKRNLIEDHLVLLESAGLWPYIIDVDSFALGNAFELYALLSTNQEKAEPNISTALIDIGSVKTALNIMFNVNSYFTREISIAGNDFTDAISKKTGLQPAQAEALKCDPGDKTEEIKDITSGLVDDLIHEIQLSFDYFEHQFEKPIDSIYLSGGSSHLIGLEEAFENTFQKKPVWWNPLEYIEIASEHITKEELNRHTSQLGIAVGLASRIRKG